MIRPSEFIHPEDAAALRQLESIWHSCSGECKRVLSGHTGSVNSAVYSSDGIYIVKASDVNTIKVWNVKELREVYFMEFPYPYGGQCATFSPNGRTIAVSGWDENINLIDFPPLQELIDQTRARFENSPLTPEERRQYYLE